MEKINKNDFVEIEFTGYSQGLAFDTTSKEEANKLGLEADVKPIIISVGNQMIINGFDNALAGKEIGKEYTINIQPKEAFGPRNPSLIRTIPLKVFVQKQINPYPGLTVQLDNYLAKILSVSGGRVIVDFNNPLAGKEIEYKFKVTKKVNDEKDKVNAIQDFFFKQRFEFEFKDKKVIFKEEKLRPLIELMNPKLKEISGFDFLVEDKKKEKEEKKEENTDSKKHE